MHILTFLHLCSILLCVHCASQQNCTGFLLQHCRRCNNTVCIECQSGFTPCNLQEWSSIDVCCPGNCAQGSAIWNSLEEIRCIRCVDSYYGDDCKNRCRQRCIKCEQLSGDCVKCAPGYSGDYCCPENCNEKLCNPSDGQCYACKEGFYGQYCDKPCPVLCLNKTCLSSGVCFSCENGYYGTFCDASCPKNCLQCLRSNGRCELCKEGYYDSSCGGCPDYCYGGICNITTGKCTDGCTNGFYGTTCSYACPNECQRSVCFQGTGDCLSCEAGKFGRQCQYDCPDNCVEKVCHQVTGVCLSGCINGKYGNHCNYTCSSICKDYSCKQENGECTSGCFDNLTYGPLCNLSCPKPCNENKCFFNGKCFSCVNGFHGEFCNTSCPSGCRTNSNADKACDMHTGTCFHGCVNGFYGEMCDKQCEDACNSTACDRDATDCLLFYMSQSSDTGLNDKTYSTAIVYGIAGVSVFVLIVGTLLCVKAAQVRRAFNQTKLANLAGFTSESTNKNKLPTEQSSTGMVTYDNIPMKDLHQSAKKAVNYTWTLRNLMMQVTTLPCHELNRTI